MTFGELGVGSDAVAGFVQHSLPDDQSMVIVIGHKEPEMILGFLGCAKAGHPYVPLDASLPPHRVERVAEIAEAQLVLTADSVREALAARHAPRAVKSEPDDGYYVMFTSGSTGEPKGVIVTLRCLTSFVEWMLGEHHFLNREEVFLNQAPFSFDLSVMDTYLSLVTGGTLTSLTNTQISDPRRLFQSLTNTPLTTWVSTPSFAQLCLAERSFDARMVPTVRRFLFCGETLPSRVAEQLLERFPDAEVWNTYGPTEATVATTSIHVSRDILDRYPTLPIGRPKPDCVIELLDPEGGAAAKGERGEIVIAGPNVSPGYVNRPDLSARSFFGMNGLRAYRTGDWGHFEDGLLFFDGRTDSQIKLHGYRIEIGDVETNLRALAGVDDAVVIPLRRHGQVDALAAFVITERQSGETDFETGARLRQALGERIPAYMVPRVLEVVTRFPMTVNGKVDRRALVESLS